MGLKLAVFASWCLFFPQKSLTEADNVLSLCFRLDDKCHCGVFWNSMAEEPIISQNPNFVMLCDEEGLESCREMCIAMVSVYVTRNNNYRQKVCTLSLLPCIKAMISRTSPLYQLLEQAHIYLCLSRV
jgi:hypothetical protein